MSKETLEAEVIEDFNAPVLKSAKELSTLVNVDDLISTYKEISEIDINLPVEVISENFLSIEKGFKAFRKARTSLEAKRKEIGEPAFKFHKRVIEIAKEVQGMINPYEDKLKALVDKVENEEKRKQLEIEMAEANRVSTIKGSIESMRNMPLGYFNVSSDGIRDAIDSIEIPDSKNFEEFLDDAVQVYKTTIEQLQNMYATKVQAEGAEEAERKNQERLNQEKAQHEEAQRIEREAFEAEKAEFQKQKDALAYAEAQRQEALDIRQAEIEAEEAIKKQDQEKKDRMVKASIEREDKIQETLSAMNKYNDNALMLNEIMAGAIPNLRWEF